jgi:hypothetical protein
LHLRGVEFKLLALDRQMFGFSDTGNQQSLVAVAGDAEAYGIELAVLWQARALFRVAHIAEVAHFRFF